uniref:Protein kinase domain-containing protein n=1 Tax=Triparma pacifica TaxID=91992 RepID=A0A7S2QVG9_9STRA
MDDEADQVALDRLVNIIRNEEQEYNEEEKRAIKKGKEFYEKCKVIEKIKKLSCADKRVEMKLVQLDGESLVTGIATTVVDASVEECAAFQYFLDSREHKKKSEERKILEQQIRHVNSHTLYYSTTRQISTVSRYRDWRSKVTWLKEVDGSICIDFSDTKDTMEEFPVKEGNVLASAHTVWIFEPEDPIGEIPQTRVTFTSRVDAGGNVPAKAMTYISKRFGAVVSKLRMKFDKGDEIAEYKTGGSIKLTRDKIEQSLLVDSFELVFERDRKGDRVSLARGAFGNVLVADYHSTRCAYKEIHPADLSDATLKKFFLELKLIGTLRHPNIAQCIGVVWEMEEHGIMFELCKNGGLDDFLKKHAALGLISWKNTETVEAAHREMAKRSVKKNGTIAMMLTKGIGLKSRWAHEIAKGSAFLHGKEPAILHRDLKGANVLVGDDFTAKITDFGESRHLGGVIEEEQKTMTPAVGTPHFMAPEVFSTDIKDKIYGKAIDVYSFGMLLLELFYDGRISKGFKKGWGHLVIMNRVSKGWRPDLKLVREEDEDLADIIEQCWSQDPSERPTFQDIIIFFDEKLKQLEVESEEEEDQIDKTKKGTKNETIPTERDEESGSDPMSKISLANENQEKSNIDIANKNVRKKEVKEHQGADAIDPMDIFAMAKLQDEKKVTKKRDPDDQQKVILKIASRNEDEKQKVEEITTRDDEYEGLNVQQKQMKAMLGKQDFWLL